MSRWSVHAVPIAEGVVQWVHESAEPWRTHLRELLVEGTGCSPLLGVEACGVIRWTPEIRCAKLLDLANSVRAIYLALDLPPTADPVYARAAPTRWDRGFGGRWPQHILTLLADSSCRPDLEWLHPRCWLNVDATLDLSDFRSGFDDGRDSCSAWTSWWYQRDTCYATGAGNVWGRGRPPLSECWDLLVEIGTGLTTRSVDEILAESRIYATRENLRVAREAGVEDATGLIGLAAERMALAHEPSDEVTAFKDILRAAVAPAAAASPIAGAILGLAYGVVELVTSLGAVAHRVDQFGREGPAFEPVRLTGQLAPEREPLQDVPEPAAPPPLVLGPEVGMATREEAAPPGGIRPADIYAVCRGLRKTRRAKCRRRRRLARKRGLI